MINLVNDLLRIVKGDTEHDLEITIDSCGVKIYIVCEPMHSEKIKIPVYYDVDERLSYIPDDVYRKVYEEGHDFGIDLSEIKLIKEIMIFLEENEKDIKEICDGCSFNRNGLNL